MGVWHFLGVPWVCLRFALFGMIVVFPDHTHLLVLSFIHNMDMVIHSDNRRRNMYLNTVALTLI